MLIEEYIQENYKIHIYHGLKEEKEYFIIIKMTFMIEKMNKEMEKELYIGKRKVNKQVILKMI